MLYLKDYDICSHIVCYTYIVYLKVTIVLKVRIIDNLIWSIEIVNNLMLKGICILAIMLRLIKII